MFPESVGLDPASGDAYVGSLADGALYRLRGTADVEVWSPAGADERKAVAGVKVDSQGRLWAAGGYEGTLCVYDLISRSLIVRFDVGARPSCVNDIAFGPAGEAYVTDSLISLLFRVAGEPLAIEAWVDLAEQGVPWAEGLNFNGIVLTPDRRHLVACQTNLGRLWQIELETGQLKGVALHGGPLRSTATEWRCPIDSVRGDQRAPPDRRRRARKGRRGGESHEDPPKRRVRVSDRRRRPGRTATRSQQSNGQDGSRAAASVHGRRDRDNRWLTGSSGRRNTPPSCATRRRSAGEIAGAGSTPAIWLVASGALNAQRVGL